MNDELEKSVKVAYEKIIDAVKTAHESFLNQIDVKSSTVEFFDGSKIVIFPAIKKNLSPKQARKERARELTKQRGANE